MRCTAHPNCQSEATFTLVNAKSRVVLGFNCDAHLAPLLLKRDDYDKMPLPTSDDELPDWYKNWERE